MKTYNLKNVDEWDIIQDEIGFVLQGSENVSFDINTNDFLTIVLVQHGVEILLVHDLSYFQVNFIINGSFDLKFIKKRENQLSFIKFSAVQRSLVQTDDVKKFTVIENKQPRNFDMERIKFLSEYNEKKRNLSMKREIAEMRAFNDAKFEAIMKEKEDAEKVVEDDDAETDDKEGVAGGKKSTKTKAGT